MLDPRTKFPHTVGATWGNALATFQNAGFWCATTLLAHYIPGFRGTEWKSQGHWQPVGEFGVSVRGASAKGRSFVLLGEGVKAQVVKSGLRPLALGRWVVHHIPSRSERDLGKCSGTTPKNRECGAQQAQCKYKNSAPGEKLQPDALSE
ncbi:hypothetical protein [uncultured Corynebacterium sp.]|uniref:hypothetical protein n=1 Tax=uncultured Corynebacterium sp. TaxID=159447 RepID=UPI00259BB50A|nr:hypothetical protein [uncultured Corynebacterium sp.]